MLGVGGSQQRPGEGGGLPVLRAHSQTQSQLGRWEQGQKLS